MEISIRNARYEDIEDVVEIQVTGWQAAYRGIIDDDYLDNMDRKSKIEKRQQDWNQGDFIVAEKDNKIVGFCRFSNSVDDPELSDNSDCELRAIYVKPDMKRMGIGKKMFENAINTFKSRDKKQMVLWCLKDNWASRAFYEKMGGTVVGLSLFEVGNKNYEIVGYKYNLNELNY